MKLDSKEFEKYVINEIRNLSQKENWNSDLQNIISEQTYTFLKQDDYELVEPQNIESEENKLDLKKVNHLNEELKRMRQLVDFRNPLFSKENN